MLLVRLAFMEVRAMCVSSKRRIESFVSQSSPELTAPRLRAGTNMLVCEQLA